MCERMGHPSRWRGEIENEVERALTKAVRHPPLYRPSPPANLPHQIPISQRHPSLRPYYTHLTILSARLSHIQGNPRFAHNTLKRLFSNFLITTPGPHLPPDPPHILYAAHLALIHSHATEARSPSPSPGHSPTKRAANPALQRALGAIQDLHALASSRVPAASSSPPTPRKNGHAQVALLARFLFLHTLVRHGEWERVGPALELAEAEAGFWDVGNGSPEAGGDAGRQEAAASMGKDTVPVGTKEAATLQLEIHILIMGVVYHTYAGTAAKAAERLGRLHAILDSVGVDKGGDGVVEVWFAGEDGRPLYLAGTHPSVVYAVAFLLSAVAKRDAVGRKPKKGVFAREGLAVLERGGWGVPATDVAASRSLHGGEGDAVPVPIKEVMGKRLLQG
jgi:hypothetical protein